MLVDTKQVGKIENRIFLISKFYFPMVVKNLIFEKNFVQKIKKIGSKTWEICVKKLTNLCHEIWKFLAKNKKKSFCKISNHEQALSGSWVGSDR